MDSNRHSLKSAETNAQTIIVLASNYNGDHQLDIKKA